MYYKYVAKFSYEEGVTYEEKGLVTGADYKNAVFNIESQYGEGLESLYIERISYYDKFVLILNENVYNSL